MSYNLEKADLARIIVGNANSLHIHTGNIINWHMLKKHKFHPSMTSSDELMDALHSAMQSWIRSIVVDPLNIPEPQLALNVVHLELVTPIDLEERDKLKLSVKLFLCDWSPDVVRHAVHKLLHELGVQCLDSVLVAFPITLPSTGSILENKISPIASDFSKILPIWKELESIVENKFITNIGVCDFDHEGLEMLHNSASVKPSTNQINLTNCCAVPTELIQLSRETNVELLTHNDPAEILSARSFQSFMSESTEDGDASTWSPSYIARYSVLIRCRGIVHSKGYITSAQRHEASGNVEDYGFF